MTAPAKAPVYVSGHCGIGAHTTCRGTYAGVACNCGCEHKPEAAGVNDADAVAAPANAEKDAPNDGHLSPSGVPAPAAGLDLLDLPGTVADLSRDVAGWVDTAAELEVLDALATIRSARQALAQIEAVLEHRAARVMTGDVVEWPGGLAERRFGKTCKAWATEDLTRVAINKIVEDLAVTADANGEVRQDPEVAGIARSAATAFADLARPEWRVTALKASGIDPDDFCESVPGRVSVTITAAGPQ